MSYRLFNQIKWQIKRQITWIVSLGLLILPTLSHAGQMELSGTFSFSQSNFGENSYQWTRRWGASVGYYFFSRSELEFAVQDVTYRTKIDSVEDTTLHDKIYSLNWVQSILPRSATIQPYFKVGFGQLVRKASGTYLDFFTPSSYTSLTGVIGAGLRIYVFHSLSLKFEAVSYLAGGSVASWRDNVSVNGGLSLYF